MVDPPQDDGCDKRPGTVPSPQAAGPHPSAPADQTSPAPGQGVSRRGFLKGVGGGLLGTAAVAEGLLGEEVAAAAAGPPTLSGRHTIELRANGQVHRVEVEPRTTLLEALRDGLHLTGAKEVCDRGQCGACTVLVDGETRLACMALAVDVGDAEITTVEGLGDADRPSAVQQAFVDEDGMMCGFCTPGFVVTAEALLRANPAPTQAQIRQAVSGNLCRCGAYPKILASIRTAAEAKGG